MKKKLQAILLSAVAVPVFAFGLAVLTPAAVTPSAHAAPETGGVENGLAGGINDAGGDNPSLAKNLFGSTGIFKNVVNILLYIVGSIAVIMLIIGGIRYVVSGGDSGAVTSAKNTILYAIIGIVVCFLAYAVVNWVIGSLDTTTA